MSIAAQGSLVEVQDAANAFQLVGCVTSIDISGAEAPEIDTTCLADAAKSFRLGLKDNGTMTLEVQWDPTDVGQARLQTLFDADPIPVEQFRVTLNTPDTNADTLTFDGLVSGFDKTAGIDAVWTATITVRITGAVTYTNN